jgi:hypothetical protein
MLLCWTHPAVDVGLRVGAVLLGLKRKYHDAHITVLVRNENELPIFEAMGVKILHSSGTDRELLINHFSEHHYDCVINCASADGLELAQNILAALKSRKELTGKVQNYLHSRCGPFVLRRNHFRSPLFLFAVAVALLAMNLPEISKRPQRKFGM